MSDQQKNKQVEEALRYELFELKSRLQRGDASAAPRLREIFQEHSELWHTAGDLNQLSKSALIGRFAKADRFFYEQITAKLDQQFMQLIDDEAPHVLRLALDHLILCWLQYQLLVYDEAMQKDASPAWVRARDQRLCGAQKRYLKSLVMFNSLQELLMPRPAAAKSVEQTTSARAAGDEPATKRTPTEIETEDRTFVPTGVGPISPNRIGAILSLHDIVCNAPDK